MKDSFVFRLKDLISTTRPTGKQAGDEEQGGERLKGRRDGGRRRERDGTGRRAASEGRDVSNEPESLRWRVTQLEKERLELASRHNQEVRICSG